MNSFQGGVPAKLRSAPMGVPTAVRRHSPRTTTLVGAQAGSMTRGPVRKSTCRSCQRTVRIETADDGTTHICDPELIAIVYQTNVQGRKVSKKGMAYRLHSEQCAAYKAADERKAWAMEQRRKQRGPTVREQAAHRKAVNAAKRAGATPPTAPWEQAATPANLIPISRYANIDEARKVVQARYREMDRLRAKL